MLRLARSAKRALPGIARLGDVPCTGHTLPEVEGDCVWHSAVRGLFTAGVASVSTEGGDENVVKAQLRLNEHRYDVMRLRKAGRTPGILFSLPDNKDVLVSMDSKHISQKVRKFGRRGITCQVFSLQLDRGQAAPPETFPVLPRMVHMNAVTGEVENVTFMHCPPQRRVRVNVPVQVLGEDMSPGLKRGGYLNLIRRRIKVACTGASIPGQLTIDVSELNFGDRIYLDALALPEGAAIAEAHPDHPVCKLSGKANRS